MAIELCLLIQWIPLPWQASFHGRSFRVNPTKPLSFSTKVAPEPPASPAPVHLDHADEVSIVCDQEVIEVVSRCNHGVLTRACGKCKNDDHPTPDEVVLPADARQKRKLCEEVETEGSGECVPGAVEEGRGVRGAEEVVVQVESVCRGKLIEEKQRIINDAGAIYLLHLNCLCRCCCLSKYP